MTATCEDAYCHNPFHEHDTEGWPAAETGCPRCGHAPHGDQDCEHITGYDHLNGDHDCGCPGQGEVTAANQRLVVLDVIADHRRVRNVRSCSARHCAWRPERSGNTSDPEDTLARHHQFNQHLADVIVDRLAQL